MIKTGRRDFLKTAGIFSALLVAKPFFGKADAKAPVTLAAAELSLLFTEKRGPQAAFFFLKLGGDLEPLIEQLPGRSHNGIRVHVRAELQLIQQLNVILAELRRLPYGPLKMCQSHSVIKTVILHIAQLSDQRSGIVLTKRFQHRTSRQFLLIQGIFQSQPQQSLVGIAVLILVQGFE